MKEFFSSLRFKIFLVVALLLLGLLLYAGTSGSTVPSSVLSAITSPIQRASAAISSFFSGEPSDLDLLREENRQLKEQVRALTQQLVDFHTYQTENQHYKEYLGIKEQNPDFIFEPATLIARDSNERFYAFTINKGAAHGISEKDTVITSDGLVGYVSQVDATTSKVVTILDTAVSIGAYDSQTRASGMIEGDVTLATQNLTRLNYLQKDSSIAVGDIVVTSGLSGLFPEGLVVGSVYEVKASSDGVGSYAVVKPAADIQDVRDVFVIKSFDSAGDAGQQPAESGAQ